MATAVPILDLSTLISDRPVIRIDGQIYHLLAPDELTLAQSHKFTGWAKELEELGKAPDRLAELETLLRIVAGNALADVSDEVFMRLSPSHHLAIVEVFTVLLLGRRSRLTGAVLSAAGVRSTGASSSPGSSGPMAATPDGGSTARQARSSGPM